MVKVVLTLGPFQFVLALGLETKMASRHSQFNDSVNFIVYSSESSISKEDEKITHLPKCHNFLRLFGEFRENWGADRD